MPTEEQQNDLDGVLNQLERSPEPAQSPPAADAEYLSPTVALLEERRRPKPSPVCAACPNSLWFATAEHLKCYCRLMHAVTWNSEEPKPIATCDGILLSSD